MKERLTFEHRNIGITNMMGDRLQCTSNDYSFDPGRYFQKMENIIHDICLWTETKRSYIHVQM